jgi:hypothetical protein
MVRELYAHDTHSQSAGHGWMFVSTIDNKKSLYSKWAIAGVNNACQTQNIIMFPGMHEFIKIAN